LKIYLKYIFLIHRNQPVTVAKFINKSSLFILLLGVIPHSGASLPPCFVYGELVPGLLIALQNTALQVLLNAAAQDSCTQRLASILRQFTIFYLHTWTNEGQNPS
ncbi:MAG: hypothetical protein ABJB05_05885, partial [Parafilimonas sp.]